MANKFLKLDKPCTENWEHMTPNEQGRFCQLCAKTVIDFSNLSPIEITKQLKQARGSVCARVSKKQLKTPLIDIEQKKSLRFPYSNVAAGLMIATALTLNPVAQAALPTVQTEWVSTLQHSSSSLHHSVTPEMLAAVNDNESIVFKGKVQSVDNATPIKNAKVLFITLTDVFATYTAEDGTFSLVIPSELIDDNNVLRVTYDDVIIQDNDEEIHFYGGYEMADYVLSREEVTSNYVVNAHREMLVLGGMMYQEEKANPAVVHNGKPMKYKAFLAVLRDIYEERDTNSSYIYLEAREGKALYGNKAQHGLYILFDYQIP